VLARHRPMLSVEVGDVEVPGIVSSRQVVDHLLALGYRAFEAGGAGEAFRPHAPREHYEYDNLVFLP